MSQSGQPTTESVGTREKENKMNRQEIMAEVRRQGMNELAYRIETYWDEGEQEREGLTDAEYIIREAEFVVEDYTEDTGNCMHDEWKWAKWLLRRTSNGKRRPIGLATMSIKEGFTDADIERARGILEEVKRTKAFIRKMQKNATK